MSNITNLEIKGHAVIIEVVDPSPYPGMDYAADITIDNNNIGVLFGVCADYENPEPMACIIGDVEWIITEEPHLLTDGLEKAWF